MLNMTDLVPDLKTILGQEDDTEDGLLAVLLAQAQAEAQAITGRTSLPDGLRSAVIDLAVLRYNRRGLEGEAQRSEGGVSAQIDALPVPLRKVLKRYTLAGVGVMSCEAE